MSINSNETDNTEPHDTASDAHAGPELAADTPRRRWIRWVGVGTVAVVAIAAIGYYTQRDSSEADVGTSTALAFGDVVVTDLVEETIYDGTLGRPAGESLAAGSAGTITSLPAVGETLTQGDVVFAVDARSVILLFGETPHFRTIARSSDDQAVVSRTQGTITAIADVGTVIEQGDVLFAVDGNPVIALYGDTPAYRGLADLSTNLTGPDVLQLEEALDALGFVSDGEMTIDDEFTSATASVVEQWQAAASLDEDGVVDLGEIVFITGPTEVSSAMLAIGDSVGAGQVVVSVSDSDPMTGADVEQLESALAALGYNADGALAVDGQFTAETSLAVKAFETDYGLTVDGRITADEVMFVAASVRVADRLGSLGGTVGPGTPVLAVTGEQTVVTIELPAADQGTLTEGMSVTVELPDGTDVSATVTSVATVATIAGNETVFEVEVELDDPTAAAGLDEAPVDVSVITDSVENVMAVPVAALLALAEGGYAVELDTGGGTTRLVSVEPGFFADGLVEIVSDGVEPGDRVVVP